MARDLRILGLAGVHDFGNLHFDPEEYGQAIEDYGIGCELRRGVMCPCARVESHQARANCQHCGGTGWLWPKDYRSSIVAFVFSRRPHDNQEAAGTATTGQVQISFPLGVVPGEGDMILPVAERHVVHQVLFRELLQEDPRAAWARTTNPGARPPKQPPMVDRVLYPDAEIERCYWLNENKELCSAVEGLDYRVTEGIITWLPGRGPFSSGAYTLRYQAPAAYVLLPGDAKFRSDTSNVLPYQAAGVRLDRWGHPDFQGA